MFFLFENIRREYDFLCFQLLYLTWVEWCKMLGLSGAASAPVEPKGKKMFFFCFFSVVLVPLELQDGGEPPVGHHRVRCGAHLRWWSHPPYRALGCWEAAAFFLE